MRKYPLLSFVFPVLLLLSLSLFAYEPIEEKEPLLSQVEIAVLDQLISTSEQKLQVQKKLKGRMQELQAQRDAFLAGNQTKRHSYKMVHTAKEILEIIEQEHLGHLFSKEYLDELIVFTSIAGRASPVRPE